MSGVFLAERITFEDIFNALDAEKKTGELLPLPKGFYRYADENISRENAPNSEYEKENENLSRTTRALRARRTQKILIYLAYGKQLPYPMPEEEEELHRRLKIVVESATGEKLTRIKIIARTPELITPNGKRIGPYEENEVIEVSDKHDTEYILNNKIGEILNL